MSKIINNQKQCSKCKKTLNLSEFYKDKKVKCGLSAQCKKCSNQYNKVGTYYIIDGKKRCTKCNISHPIGFFYEDKKIKSGLSSQCKLCNPKKVKVIKPPKPVIEKIEPKVDEGFKLCVTCKEIKLLENFNLTSKEKNTCKDCKHKRIKNWMKNNPERRKEIKRKYKNKIKLINQKKREALREEKLKAIELKKTLKKERVLRNKLEQERISEEFKQKQLYWKSQEYIDNKKRKRRKREKIKMKDPLFAFKKKLRNNIRKALKSRSYSKNSHAAKILGTTWEEIFSYFESKFQPGMTWENHGEWHIDHIIPLASAKNEEELIKLNHYTNLQPLWGKENLLKGDRMF